MYEMWKATIKEMLEEFSPDEVKASLQERYPEIPELMALVDELSGRISSSFVRRFCKQGQASVTDMGAPDTGMQSNFSIPNSEGEAGPGTVLPGDTPQAGSYTGRLIDRDTLRKRKKEKEERRKRRKELLDRLGTQPGGHLTGRRPGANPGSATEEIQKELEQSRETLRAPSPPQSQSPGGAPIPGPDATKVIEDNQKIQDSFKKTRQKAKETTEEVQDAADNSSKAVEELEKSITDLLQ